MQRQTLKCTSSPQQLDIHASSLTRRRQNRRKRESRRGEIKRSPKASINASSRGFSRGDFSSVPNFRVQLLSCGVSSLRYPDWRHFNQGGEAESLSLWRAPSDAPRGNSSSFAPSGFFVGERSVRVFFTHRFHVKTGAINFGRAAVESLVPPYFHTQGGLQKYVGGARCYVTCVRGLVEGTRVDIVFFLFENKVDPYTHRWPGKNAFLISHVELSKKKQLQNRISYKLKKKKKEVKGVLEKKGFCLDNEKIFITENVPFTKPNIL